MQKTTSSTIISVALLALLVWALSSGKKDAKPRKDSEAAQLAAKDLDAVAVEMGCGKLPAVGSDEQVSRPDLAMGRGVFEDVLDQQLRGLFLNQDRPYAGDTEVVVPAAGNSIGAPPGLNRPGAAILVVVNLANGW